MSISFHEDIKPLFRIKDVNAMATFGGFNLHKYEDVKERVDDIFARLEDGSMPCDGAWSDSNIKVFRLWKDGGMLP